MSQTISLDVHLEHSMRVRARLGDTEYFVEANRPLASNVESGLAAIFFPALANGDTVFAADAADRVFLEHMQELATVASQWWGWKERNPLSVPVSPAPRPAAPDAAMFFTGGVDSFCSFLRHPAEIQGLIHVHGFDISLADTERYTKAKRWIDNVARACKVEPVYIRTNLRENAVFNTLGWGITHVAALAGVAHLLDRHFGRIFLASSDVPPPYGSNQRIDPLWSSGNVQIINDGWRLSRLEKVKFISGSSLVHKYLKVCWENRSSDLNCGYCEKCVRTQAQFAVSGTFECLETFPRGRLKEKIDGVPSAETRLVKQWADICREMRDPELRNAVERLVLRSHDNKRKESLPAGMKRLLKSLVSRNI